MSILFALIFSVGRNVLLALEDIANPRVLIFLANISIRFLVLLLATSNLHVLKKKIMPLVFSLK